MLIVGLDISTRVIGVCVVNGDAKKPLYLGWIKLRDDTMWRKAAQTRWELEAIRDHVLALSEEGGLPRVPARIKSPMPRPIHPPERTVRGLEGTLIKVGYEEPLTRLTAGRGGSMSSAGIITTLARFNGMVGLIASEVFGDPEPRGFTVHDGRKLSGVRISRKSKKRHKDQVFEWVCKEIGDLWIEERVKRNGEVVVRDECMDATDAWVVAAAYNKFLSADPEPESTSLPKKKVAKKSVKLDPPIKRKKKG